MLIPTFRLNLAHPALPGLVALGKFDGSTPSLAFATSQDTILIHSPHTRGENAQHEVRQLAVNRQISSLLTGDLQALNAAQPQDLLFVGTETNLLAYNVETNSDVFYKDIPDGVRALGYGLVSSSPTPLCIVGGNGSLQGFDAKGQEKFWTVTNDNVSSICFRNLGGGSSAQELIVGLDDSSIRGLSEGETTFEIHENDVVSGLVPIHSAVLGFALKNGTVGVYNGTMRVWQAKSKHRAVSITSFDLDSDGVPELVTGWSNGRMEVRHSETGDLVYKDKFSGSLAKVLVSDYRMDNKPQIMACGVDGDVRGYLPNEPIEGGGGAVAPLIDPESVEDNRKFLQEKKSELMNELKSIETSLKNAKAGKPAVTNSIPASTKLTVTVRPNKVHQCLMLSLQTNNDTVIKMVLVFCDALFEQESKVMCPAKPSGTLSVPIRMDKNIECELGIKCVIGHKSSPQDYVFEMLHVLPKFSTFIYCKPRDLASVQPRGTVTFTTTERVNRVVLWLTTSFPLDSQTPNLHLAVTSDSLHAAFLSSRDGSPLMLRMTPEQGGLIQVRVDNMETAGDLIQDMCRYMKIEELESTADFPADMEEIDQLFIKVSEYNDARRKMNVDMAEQSQAIKMSLIQAEDARMLGDSKAMVARYRQVYDSNVELLGEYRKRMNNQDELLKSLKQINQIIQKAARLRMGEAKAAVIAACRKAVKENNRQAFAKVVRTGHD